MCNLSQWVLETGIQQGIETGIQQGIQRRNMEFAEELVKEGTFSDEFIMRVAGITKEKLDELKEQFMCRA